MKTCDSKEMVALLWVLGASPQSLRAKFMASVVKERVSPHPSETYRPGDQKVPGCGGCYCHCHQRKRKGGGRQVGRGKRGMRVMETTAVTLRLGSGRSRVPPGPERDQGLRGSEAESPALGQPPRWVDSAPEIFILFQQHPSSGASFQPVLGMRSFQEPVAPLG